MSCLSRLSCTIGVLLAMTGQPSIAQERTITVFAAASLKSAFDDVNAAYTAKTGVRISGSYAASSALARQIEQGAPADVFASADLAWMDYAIGKQAIDETTRVNLLGNRLVLIAPADSTVGEIVIGQGFDLAKLAGDGRIAVGEVQSVPAGKYARSALERLGSWDTAAAKLAMADNVRAALTLVARREAVLGIVYETDAKVEPKVKVVGRFPAASHPAIVYPFAVVVNAKPEAGDYLAFLRSSDAKAVFEKYGFTFLLRPVS